MKKLVGIAAAGVCSTGLVVGGLTLGQGPAHAASNCHSYGATGVAANRAITAACDEIDKGTQYSWAGGHGTRPGPSTGTVHNRGSVHFDDRNRVGLDCSGLVRWAWYRATGVDFGAGSSWAMPAELTSHGFARIGGTRPTRPGDVVVYAGHTAIYLGQGLVVQAANHAVGLNVAGLATEPRSVTGVFRYTGAPTSRPEPKQRSKPETSPESEPKGETRSAPRATPKRAPEPKSKPKPTSKAKPNSAAKPAPKSTAKSKPADADRKHQQVRADAPTYLVPVAWHDVGILRKGRRHFDCQVVSVGHAFRGRQSNWWLKTDDTSGNRNVWMSATYLSSDANGARVPGIPIC